jgi:hypothetical protein
MYDQLAGRPPGWHLAQVAASQCKIETMTQASNVLHNAKTLFCMKQRP